MNERRISYQEVAKLALALIAKANIQADDESLALTMATRQMLGQIVTGELIVSPPPKPKPPKGQKAVHSSSCPAAAQMGPCNCGADKAPEPPPPMVLAEEDEED